MTQDKSSTPSTEDNQSSLLDILANRSARQVLEEGLKMTDISGQKYFQLFSKSDQIGLLSKMLVGTSLWGSTKCSLTWQTKPITQSRHFILELYPSTLPTEECDSGLWATATTMEHLPPGISGSFKESQNGRRQISSNLRDQVMQKDQEMWPTPATKGYGHASEGQVANLLKKVQEGKITMKEAEQMVSLKTLKNHRTYKKLWPTPRASEIMHQKLTPKLAARAKDYGNLEEAVATTMWPTTTATERSGINPKTKKGGGLSKAAKMWPTPMASEGFKQTKKWREENQNSLTAWVFNPEKNPQMFSTPTARDHKGSTITPNHPEGFNKSLCKDVMMWPTPATSNSRGAVKNRFMGSETYRGNLDEAVRTHQEDMHLSADWVEWLMGYPPGWTNLPESPEQDQASKEELPD